MKKPKKVLVLGSGAIKIGWAGIIEKDGRIAPNRSYYWKIKEGNQCEA